VRTEGPRARLIICLCIVLAGFLPPNGAHAANPAIGLKLVLDGFTKPVYAADADDGSGRLFVVEKRGLIRIVRDGERIKEPFLDLRGVVTSEGNEQGLLSVAFHPEYAENGRFFIAYTDLDGDVVIARYTVSREDPTLADPASAVVLLTISKPYDDHNGGLLVFGPDGYLYASVGDGGAPAEQDGNGQNLQTMLGKLLRIDVNREENGKSYAVPDDNPFVGNPDALPEIWAFGLRNPWRFSFDRETDDLYIADVGMWMSEEINLQPAGDAGGRNYGWNIMEGNLCHTPDSNGVCLTDGLTPPVHEYHHGAECAIIGGYVYRGSSVQELGGWYVFGDLCSGRIMGLERSEDGWAAYNLTKTPLQITSFGEDATGELYVTDLSGGLYRVVERPDGVRGWQVT
jgi:glucose/arabinose dehydrogenase